MWRPTEHGVRTRDEALPRVCPACGSASVARLIFGYPSKQGKALVRRGEAVMAGCLCWGDERDPRWACTACGERWGAIVQLPFGLSD